MDNERFTQVVKHQIQKCEDTLLNKAKEYASDEDRLHNFRAAAGLTGESMQKVLAGFMLKHTVSLYDMVEGEDTYTLEQWEEKIGDHLNYLLLLKAVLVDDRDRRPATKSFGDAFVKSNIVNKDDAAFPPGV